MLDQDSSTLLSKFDDYNVDKYTEYIISYPNLFQTIKKQWASFTQYKFTKTTKLIKVSQHFSCQIKRSETLNVFSNINFFFYSNQ